MTARQIVWFIAGYIAIVVLAIGSILPYCGQGLAKFKRRRAGLRIYIPTWGIFLAPLPIAAISFFTFRALEEAASSARRLASRYALWPGGSCWSPKSDFLS